MTWPPHRGPSYNDHHRPYVNNQNNPPSQHTHRRDPPHPPPLIPSYGSSPGYHAMSESKHDPGPPPSASFSSNPHSDPNQKNHNIGAPSLGANRSLPSISHMMFSNPPAGKNGAPHGYNAGPSHGIGSTDGTNGGGGGGGQHVGSSAASQTSGPYSASSANGSFPNSTLPPLADGGRLPHHMNGVAVHPPSHTQHPGGNPYYFRPQYAAAPAGYPPTGDPYGHPSGGYYHPHSAELGPAPVDPQGNFAPTGYDAHDQQGHDGRGGPAGSGVDMAAGSRQPLLNMGNARGGGEVSGVGEQPSLGPEDRIRKVGNEEGFAPPSAKRAKHEQDFAGGSRHPGMGSQLDEGSVGRRSTEDFAGQPGGDSALSHIIQSEAMVGEKPGGRTLKRTYQACIRCRKKKLKCDSALTRCTPCQSSASECHQADVRRQTSYPRGYVEDLESRCAMFQEILAKMLPTVSPADYPSLLQGGGLSPMVISHAPSRMMSEPGSPRSVVSHALPGMPHLPEE